MKYIGQTERSFRIRFQEHLRDFKYNNNKSKFSVHLIENKHSIGCTNDIMEILHVTNKGRSMDTIEKFHFYKETKHVTKLMTKTQ